MRQESQGKRHSAPKQVADPANDPDQCTSNVDSSYKSGKGQKVTDVEEGRQNEDGPEAKKRQGAIPKQGPSPCEKGEESIKLIPCVKQGTPTSSELQLLGSDLGREVWLQLGGCLGIKETKLDEIDESHRLLPRKGYKMLLHWKEKNGSAATYEVLSQALQHELVNKLNLAENYCYEKQN